MARLRAKRKPLSDGGSVRAQLVEARATLGRAGIPTAWLDAEVLLAHALRSRREWLHSHPEDVLTSRQRRRFHRLITRRASHVPVAYLTGEREFYGYSLHVTPAVLIPRPETELLVELAIDWLRNHRQARRVIDLGTGSGAIAIALAKAIPAVRVAATDRDARALRVAAANAKDHRLTSRISFVRRNLLTGASATDLIVANLPYLSAARRRAWAKELDFEPLRALDGGQDGLDTVKRALLQAPSVLRAGGAMLLECDPGQPRRITPLALRQWPSAMVSIHKDLAGKDRAVMIQLP